MKRIVVVDDSLTARMFVKRCLQIAGCQDAEFCEAANGKEALALLKEKASDLLVTDLNMPTMDGETLLKWVKGNPRLTDVPVMVVTSAGNPAKEEQLVGLGAFCVLNKPVNPVLLRKKLQELQPGGLHV